MQNVSRMTRVRKIRWDRVATLALAVSMMVAVVAVVATIRSAQIRRTEWENSREVVTVYVESGDTLDGFGYKYKPEWMDVREYREQIKELNEMEGSDLYMGQELKIYK